MPLEGIMQKIGTVKNPLSVIAIFAGIAEISGAAVLPHIAPESQALYIWFLMLFPFTLIVLFFVTLNWNYKVLYAPSDFENEDNFVNLQKASYEETFYKLSNEVSELEDVLEPSNDKSVNDELDNKINFNEAIKQASDQVDTSELKFSVGKISTKEEREARKDIYKRFRKLDMQEARYMENLIYTKLQNELGITIERDMKLDNGKSFVIFDGIAKNGSNLTAFEFKKLNKNTLLGRQWDSIIHRWNEFFNSLQTSEKEHFSLVFAIVTDENKEDMKAFLERHFDKLNFNISTRIFSYEDISAEISCPAS